MSLAVWLGAVRKCSAAVVGLDMALGLSMVRRCSLKRCSFIFSLLQSLLYSLNRSDQQLIQRTQAGLLFTAACLDITRFI